jgi:hypothetical protein
MCRRAPNTKSRHAVPGKKKRCSQAAAEVDPMSCNVCRAMSVVQCLSCNVGSETAHSHCPATPIVAEILTVVYRSIDNL